ncbi:MAG: hypothetical protein J1D85_01180, partial [Bacteroidales bacterium]|nr:hypothetical protein [Bacteroidales bacterium]
LENLLEGPINHGIDVLRWLGCVSHSFIKFKGLHIHRRLMRCSMLTCIRRRWANIGNQGEASKRALKKSAKSIKES